MRLGGRRPRNILLPLTIHPNEQEHLFEKHVVYYRFGDQQTTAGQERSCVLDSSMTHITVTSHAL